MPRILPPTIWRWRCAGAAYANRTLILTMLNKAYAEEGGLLDLFLESLREGDGTEQLIDHVLFVAMDQQAFRRCRSLGGGVKCYLLRPVDSQQGDLSSEQLYMSDGFIRMMWRRIRFLGDVLKHGYSFIFTVRTFVIMHACIWASPLLVHGTCISLACLDFWCF